MYVLREAYVSQLYVCVPVCVVVCVYVYIYMNILYILYIDPPAHAGRLPHGDAGVRTAPFTRRKHQSE